MLSVVPEVVIYTKLCCPLAVIPLTTPALYEKGAALNNKRVSVRLLIVGLDRNFAAVA